MLLTGDSHAAVWFPALQTIAKRRGWQLITMTKSGCPFVDVFLWKACSTWRANSWARIAQLRPDMVVVTSLDRYPFSAQDDAVFDDATWQAGMERSLRHLRKASPMVVLLGDVSPWGPGALACLELHKSDDISVCNLRRNSPSGRFTAARDRLARAAAAATGTLFHPTRQIVCPYDPCPLVVDRVLVSLEETHITATYSARLWRALDRILPRP